MPFDEEPEEEVKPKFGLKAAKTKSIFDNKPKKPSKEEFERTSSEANDRMNTYRTRAYELSMSYKKLLEDKTLVSNKPGLVAEIEADVLAQLGQLAIDMNTDENEIEGMGSVGLNSLLLRCLLLQRDRINTMDYATHILENKVKTLETKLENLSALVDSKKTSE